MVALDEAAVAGAEFRRGPEDRRPQPNGAGTMDWDDVRVFLAVARHGSLRAAGRALRLSQPTIGRRLTAFEATFGGPTLFDRLPEGLRLNAAGEQLISAAEEIKPEFVLISAGFDSRAGDPLGQFLLTDADFADLTRVMREIADKHAHGRLLSVLEGGYSLTGLASGVRSHVQALQ